MYAVAVLDREALEVFRREYPWLELTPDVIEVSLYMDENGAPVRVTAASLGASGEMQAYDVNAFGAETLLALIRHAPRGKTAMEDCPEEIEVRTLLETLPIADGIRSVDEVEAQRKQQLERAYESLRTIAANKFEQALGQAANATERDRIARNLAAIPATLPEIDEASKSIFLEVDLWRLVAIVRDEYVLPADYDLSLRKPTEKSVTGAFAAIEADALAYPLIQALFDLSPTAFSISTTGQDSSRFVRVNQAYLDLVGKAWDEIAGSEMVSSGLLTDDAGARARRLSLLDSDGGYVGEIALIRNGKGETVTVSISARRLFLSGQFYDFEVLTPIAG
ncbi:PAS domain-containing protein [Rhizobium sp. RU36D]|uniref:PAS domain-containing protein n=1 Tax=Rhizobium sp. RU36D TaxID=1907415 RepID=UPI0009D80A56|nr:PAS domain-containing protein [Rhizobium sp. RU36D]SMC60575.1 PAS domain-containing protein [Rhizobium sp. RU36D]